MLLINLTISFLCGFGPRITGIIRTIVWKIDLLRLKRLRERTESQANDDGVPQPLEAEREVEPEEVTAIGAMGFCENVVIEARRAVKRENEENESRSRIKNEVHCRFTTFSKEGF
jgi:Holliday junction resolvasome RuvABC DNA-binding subunit